MKGPNTYFGGSVAIDGIWLTEDLEVMAAANMPFDPEPRDHRPVVVNITKTPILCVNGPKIKFGSQAVKFQSQSNTGKLHY